MPKRGSYTIAAEVWTNLVQPNSSMTIGFTGTKESGVEAVLSNFRLTQVVIGESNGTATPVDPPVDDEKIEITANAAYDEENGNINVSWNTNKQEGTFDILMSTDGENFASVGTVTGVSEYVYTPESDFETLYFKVVQTVDEQSVESNIVSVTNTYLSEDIIISANGVYDAESGDITISWEQIPTMVLLRFLCQMTARILHLSVLLQVRQNMFTLPKMTLKHCILRLFRQWASSPRRAML